MTLVAHWTANTYTVKFNNTKGDNPKEDATYTYDSNVTLPIVPNIDGYTMSGWYNGNTLVSNGKWNIADDVTLTTKWTANNYTITLDRMAVLFHQQQSILLMVKIIHCQFQQILMVHLKAGIMVMKK